MNKKHTKILIPLFLVSVFICSAYAVNRAMLPDFSDVSLSYENTNRYYYDRLTENGKIAYTCILNEIETHPELIEIPKLTDEEFTDLFYAVSYDNPQILCFGKTSVVRSIGAHFYYVPEYSCTAAECALLTDEMNGAVDTFLRAVPSGLSDYEKELLAHDYISASCVYVFNKEEGVFKSSPHDALVVGEALCEGYARAVKVLLDKLGVQTYLITGNATNSDNETESHMWNIVTIDGKNYHLDLTWNDIDLSDTTTSHSYFNVTDTAISANHFDFAPSGNNCVSTDMNFFNVNNVLFDNHNSANKNALCKSAVSNIQNKLYSVEIAYTNEKAYRQALKAYVDESGIYHILEDINKQANKRFSDVRYTQDDSMYVIQFYFE